MEDAGQIVVLVIGIIVAIAQAVGKANKKAKAKQQADNSTPSLPAMDAQRPTDDPFSWLMGSREEAPVAVEVSEEEFERDLYGEYSASGYRFAEDAASGRGAEGYFSYDNAYSESIYGSTEKITTMESRVEGGRSTSGSADMLSVSAVNSSDMVRTAGHANTADERLTDFDLRQAVIYSEILKAKYQDY